MNVRCSIVLAGWAALVAVFLLAPSQRSARGDDGDALLEMVVELLASPDRDMRGLALQQVREELPGDEATRRFVEELPKLPVDAQSGLLEALGERGDAAARPLVVEKVSADNASVRTAAIGALAKLGNADDVPLLAAQIHAGSETVQAAARQSLVRLQGEKINQAILNTSAGAEPALVATLLEVLARRNAQEAIPAILEASRHETATVRIAAIRALRLLANEEHAGELVRAVKAAEDDTERYQAKLALMVLCSRHRVPCAEAIIAGLDEADPAGTVALLQALARAGGDDALAAVARRLDDQNQTVRDAAVRTLATWSDPAAAEHLAQVAETTDDLRHHVVAVRGLAFLAQPLSDRPADIAQLAKAMELARRPEEKRMVLGFAGASGDPASLAMILSSLDDPQLAAPAGLAAVLIAEHRDEDLAAFVATLRKVIETTEDKELRARARSILEPK